MNAPMTGEVRFQASTLQLHTARQGDWSVTLTRPQIADLLLQVRAEQQASAVKGSLGDRFAPGADCTDEEYALCLADLFLHLACLQAASEVFNPVVFTTHDAQRHAARQAQALAPESAA